MHVAIVKEAGIDRQVASELLNDDAIELQGVHREGSGEL